MRLTPASVRPRLSGELGVPTAALSWLIPGSLLCALFIVAFTWFGKQITHHWVITGWDNSFNEWMRSATSPDGMHIVSIVTNIGSAGIWILVALTAIWLLSAKRTSLAIFFLAVNLGGLIIQRSIKYLVHRPRPPLAEPYLHSATFSFPSGHVTGTTACYLLLAYILSKVYNWHGAQKAAAYALALAVITFITGTRLYLGVHYLSDVLSGFLIMLLWVAVCLRIRSVFAQTGEQYPKI